MIPKVKIRKGQIYKSNSNVFVEITGTKGGKYKARILTEKQGVYRGSHTLSVRVLNKYYELQE